jgi:hypothetical protein
MSENILAIGIIQDEKVHIIKRFSQHGCRYDKFIIFVDNVPDLREALACSVCDNERYLAVKLCEENKDLIKDIVEEYEPR